LPGAGLKGCGALCVIKTLLDFNEPEAAVASAGFSLFLGWPAKSAKITKKSATNDSS